MNQRKSIPPLGFSTAVAALVTMIWVYLRVFLYSDNYLPLTFVLPLLVCIWTQRRWHLATMGSLFIVLMFFKTFWWRPAGDGPLPDAAWRTLVVTVLNVLIGTAAVAGVLLLRRSLEDRNDRIATQNHELEAQAEELTQQNDELKAQTEELAQQHEEIESQAEELERQNEELHEVNARLNSREAMLEAVLATAHSGQSGTAVLRDVCQRAMEILGEPAEAIAILLTEGSELRLRAQARLECQPPLRERWPLTDSLARVVLEEERTAYVDDLAARADLAAPFVAEGTVRSLLATPLLVGGRQVGVVVACAGKVTHWTHDQFRMLEWVAAQCGFIVESLRWQETLQERASEVEAANKAKDQFLAMLSHELRTPLTPVLAATSALEMDDRLPEDAQADIAMIRRNISVQSRLVDDLLDLTRLGRGKLALHQQAVPVAEMLRDAASFVAYELDAKDQTLDFELHLPEGVAVEGDAARLQQVFWNLLRNASKFSPPQGRLQVVARVMAGDPQRVAIDVVDEGVGIAAEDMGRIFLPFEQALAQSKPDNDGGLGLGLCIAKAVVDAHGGTIRAASPGLSLGATFTVELPLTKAAPAAPPAENDASTPAPMSTPPGDRSPLRILLVEDHADSGRLLARLLRSQGHRVEYAPTIAAATTLFESNTFDLLISDLGLPDGTGLDLIRQVRELHPDLPAMCVSGYGMESDLQASRDAGFQEHLTKPVEVRQLFGAIQRLCSVPQTRG